MGLIQQPMMQQRDVGCTGGLLLGQGIPLFDPRESPEETCGIHSGSRKTQCLLRLSLPQHPIVLWCPGQIWESPATPQHILEQLHAGVSAGDMALQWQILFHHVVPRPLISPTGPQAQQAYGTFLAGVAPAWPRNDLPGLFLTHRTGNILGFKPS